MPALVNPIGVELGLPYVITGPDGTRAVINDVADPEFVGFIDSDGGITGLERAGVREVADLLPEADGGVHGAFLYDRLPFTLSVLIPPDVGTETWLGRQARLKRATNAMHADAVLAWEPSEAVPVQVSFRQQQPTRITGRRPKVALVSGVCEDPLVLSQAENSETLYVGAIESGGFESPLTSPLTIPTTHAAGELIVENAGQADTWPVIRFTGPLENPSVTFVESGAVLALIYTLAAGEFLELDTNPRRRSVKLNGTANRYSALDWPNSQWGPLVPGTNHLQLGVTSFAAGAALTAIWRDAW